MSFGGPIDVPEQRRTLARRPRPAVCAIGRQPLFDSEIGLPADVSRVMVANQNLPLRARDLDGPRPDDAFGIDPALRAEAPEDIGARVSGVAEQVLDPTPSQSPQRISPAQAPP